MKRRLSFCLALLLLITAFCGVSAGRVSAASSTIADSRSFTFSGSMSQKVLRSYCAHAVTLSGFCAEGLAADDKFDEDLRMIRSIGAKFIGRAAYYSWSGVLSQKQVEEHFSLAKSRAAAAHKADSELILQAGVFEIAYKTTVNGIAIPAYVFEAFGLPAVKRNFCFDDMIWESGQYAYSKKHWGNLESCVPNITKLETQMYFYWQITRYIDAGFESVHLGQAGMMADHNADNYSGWDRVTMLARSYAKSHARRGVVLFDCHVSLGEQLKIGDRLIMDIFAAGIVPNETKAEDGALKCEVLHYKKNAISWLGRAPGGKHPLGFTCDRQYTILEFDNYGGNGKPGVATPYAFYNWGYDDVTWFALQPEWYRNQFLAETQQYLATDADVVGAGGEQICFIQFSLRRVLTADVKRIYYQTAGTDLERMMAAAEGERSVTFTIDSIRKLITFTIGRSGSYRANNQSDDCPTGSNQEAVIRAIMAGKTVDKALFDHGIEKKSAMNHGGTAATTTTKKAGGSAVTTAAKPDSASSGGQESTPAVSSAAGGGTTNANVEPSADGEVSVDNGTANPTAPATADAVSSAADSKADDPAGSSAPWWVWLLPLPVLAAAAAAGWLIRKKGQRV